MEKEELRRYRVLCVEIEDMKRRLQEFDNIALGSPVIDGMPHGSSAPGDRIGSIIAKKTALEDQLMDRIEELMDLRQRIEDAIASLEDPVERLLMHYRYIDGMAWESICVQLNYSWPQIHRLHARCLKKLKDDTQ